MNGKTRVTELETELIYLDNAATTYPKPENVYQFADEFYRTYGGNAGRGNNPLLYDFAHGVAPKQRFVKHLTGYPLRLREKPINEILRFV